MLGAGLLASLLAVAQPEEAHGLRVRIETLERRLEDLNSRFTHGMPQHSLVRDVEPVPLVGRQMEEGMSVPTFEMIGARSRISFGVLDLSGTVLLERSEPGILALHGSLNITNDIVVNGVSFQHLIQQCQSTC
mmetsp:Transcript_12886/g.39342  ORF Transcript_12886/g.39342 Transcript_12886/m.39342 type:complete len:133 (+) Transcript_12886:43-441(+)